MYILYIYIYNHICDLMFVFRAARSLVSAHTGKTSDIERTWNCKNKVISIFLRWTVKYQIPFSSLSFGRCSAFFSLQILFMPSVGLAASLATASSSESNVAQASPVCSNLHVLLRKGRKVQSQRLQQYNWNSLSLCGESGNLRICRFVVDQRPSFIKLLRRRV